MLEMFALSQSLGKDPVLMDFWYIEASPGASCFEHSLSVCYYLTNLIETAVT